MTVLKAGMALQIYCKCKPQLPLAYVGSGGVQLFSSNIDQIQRLYWYDSFNNHFAKATAQIDQVLYNTQ